jgi:hypothetical protein
MSIFDSEIFDPDIFDTGEGIGLATPGIGLARPPTVDYVIGAGRAPIVLEHRRVISLERRPVVMQEKSELLEMMEAYSLWKKAA